MDGNRCNVSHRLHIPDLSEEFLLRKDMVGIFCQKCQKIKLFCGKRLLFPIHPDTTCRLINFDSPDFNDIVFYQITSNQSLITGKMCFYPGYKLTWGKRLGHIIICPKSQAADFINVILLCRYHKDWCIFLFPDLLTDFKAIGSWKHEVQNKQVKLLCKSPCQSCCSVVLDLNLKAAKLQIVFLQICNCYLILND